MKKLLLSLSALAMTTGVWAAEPIESQPEGTLYSTVSLTTEMTYFLYNGTTLAQDSNDSGFCTEIVVNGKEVYLKNVIHDFPAEYWIKGTTNDNNIVEFQFPQTIFEENGNEYTINMLVATKGTDGLTHYVPDTDNRMLMQWDGMTIQQINRDGSESELRVGVLNGSGNYSGYAFKGLQMSVVDLTQVNMPVTADVVPAEYACTYIDKNNDSKSLYLNVFREVDGSRIWIQGLNPEEETQLIEGQIAPSGEIVLQSEQYTGLTQGYFTFFFGGEKSDGHLVWKESATLHFDGEKIVADDILILNQGNVRPILGFSYTNLDFTPMTQVSRTPFAPEIPTGDLAPEQYTDSEGMGLACYNIWPVDVDGQALDQSKLFYNLWFDDELQEFEIDGEMTADIPYGYTDPDYMIINADEFNMALFFEEIKSFSVQTLYRNSDSDVTRSEKVTYHFENTSVANIAAPAVESVRYYNLQGIELRQPQGVCIERTVLSDGTIKTVKIKR